MLNLNRKTTNIPSDKPLKIIQFGGGNFLRAFVDWMVDELNEQTNFNAGVIVVKPTNRGAYTALRAQEGLFHVLTKGISAGKLVSQKQLIKCVQKIINPYQEWSSFLKSAEISSLRFIVSNTTESGIQFNDQDHFEGSTPIEFPAKLSLWLYHRWQYFDGNPEKGCIHLPCELIEQNGKQLKKYILQYADLWQLDKSFKVWINQHNHFCNTLVDRIVPGFPKKDTTTLFKEIGFEDHLIAEAEPYHIWAIKANKAIQSELPFDQTNLNVVFTNDLKPYRQLKVRILNGAHTTMVPVGYLSNIETVRAAVEDEKMGQFIKNSIYDEILPTLDFPIAQKKKYAADVLDRFRNPFIHHQLISIALNSTSKYKTRVLPSLIAYYQKFGKVPPHLATALAALITFYSGKRGSESIPLKDSEFALTFFKNLWQNWENNKRDTPLLVEQVLQEVQFWGRDLRKIKGLNKLVSSKIEELLTE